MCVPARGCACVCHVGMWAGARLAGAGRQGPWGSLKVSQAKGHCP